MSPFKLLEINLISAEDLPPISKSLRTFAVAYLTPDHKLTTKVDHRGNTNPSWNYKMHFTVDRKFLRQESSAVTIEIYNLALRDILIGTAHLRLAALSPPLSRNNPYRRVSLPVCRPSGHMNGTVNLAIQLLDNAGDGLSSIGSEISSNYNQNREKTESIKEEDFQIATKDESVCSTPETVHTIRPESEAETRTVRSNGSVYSPIRALPSEVEADMKRGFYAAEYGSEIFENWTEGGAATPPMSELTVDCSRRAPEKKGKLFRIFSNAYGFEFGFICGSSQMKMKNKKRNLNRLHSRALSEGNLGKYHG